MCLCSIHCIDFGMCASNTPSCHFALLRLVQTARLCCGIPDYDNYVRHVLENHPDREPMDYKTFFRERQEARYGGRNGGRCC